MTINDLVADVQAKLRDASGVFWDVESEIRPAIVEACMEATLISGEPEVGSVLTAIASGETFQAMPAGMVALTRIIGTSRIPKTTMWDLDAFQPGWQGTTSQTVQQATILSKPLAAGAGVTAVVQSSANIQAGTLIGVGAGSGFEMVTVSEVAVGSFTATFANGHAAGDPVYMPEIAAPLAWFPFGMSSWGVYPRMVSPSTVTATGIMLPITATPPWDGTQLLPFQDEFTEGLADYACHILRLKEGGAEFNSSIGQYDRCLERFGQLSRFAIRQNSLRFARGGAGSTAGVTPVEVK